MDNTQTISGQDNSGRNDVPPVIITPGQIKAGVIDPRHLVVPTTPKLGDLFYSDGTVFKRLSPGSLGQVLAVSSNNTPVWQYLLTTGTAANRPTSGTFTGAQYFSTDTFVLSVWTGSAWKATTLA